MHPAEQALCRPNVAPWTHRAIWKKYFPPYRHLLLLLSMSHLNDSDHFQENVKNKRSIKDFIYKGKKAFQTNLALFEAIIAYIMNHIHFN